MLAVISHTLCRLRNEPHGPFVMIRRRSMPVIRAARPPAKPGVYAALSPCYQWPVSLRLKPRILLLSTFDQPFVIIFTLYRIPLSMPFRPPLAPRHGDLPAPISHGSRAAAPARPSDNVSLRPHVGLCNRGARVDVASLLANEGLILSPISRQKVSAEAACDGVERPGRDAAVRAETRLSRLPLGRGRTAWAQRSRCNGTVTVSGERADYISRAPPVRSP